MSQEQIDAFVEGARFQSGLLDIVAVKKEAVKRFGERPKFRIVKLSDVYFRWDGKPEYSYNGVDDWTGYGNDSNVEKFVPDALRLFADLREHPFERELRTVRGWNGVTYRYNPNQGYFECLDSNDIWFKSFTDVMKIDIEKLNLLREKPYVD